MKMPTHRPAIGEDHANGAPCRAVAAALASELAAVRGHLAAIECLLGLPIPTAVPERCHRRSGLTEQDNHRPSSSPASRSRPPAAPALFARLSRRETEILGLLAAGWSNREIARALFLSPRTVQRHVANAYAKIGAHNKADATAYALRHRLG